MPTTTLDPPPDAATPWLTVRQAAARAQCGRKRIDAAIHGGGLKAVQVGRSFRIHVEWLDAWLDASVVVNPLAPGVAHPFRARR